jgi:hypothetical protein
MTSCQELRAFGCASEILKNSVLQTPEHVLELENDLGHVSLPFSNRLLNKMLFCGIQHATMSSLQG